MFRKKIKQKLSESNNVSLKKMQEKVKQRDKLIKNLHSKINEIQEEKIKIIEYIFNKFIIYKITN